MEQKKPVFHHIYIEEKALAYEKTQRILEKFQNSNIIKINHYKDVFNRRSQSFLEQKAEPALILAVNEGELVFPGARTCQDFGSESFYYTSQVKNCIYDCEYCFLQGMYPSANIVVFVNIDDYFKEVDRLTADKKISLSIAYDTDLPALEGLTGFVGEWCNYAAHNTKVTIEIRTKCAAAIPYDVPSNVIMAYTVSPPEVATRYEHGASTYEARKKAIYRSLEKGIKTRLCFDPVIPVGNFEKVYTTMLDDLLDSPLVDNVIDISIGSFRVSKEFIRTMQNVRLSPMTTYPYAVRDGICTFDEATLNHMTGVVRERLLRKYPESRIFEW